MNIPCSPITGQLCPCLATETPKDAKCTCGHWNALIAYGAACKAQFSGADNLPVRLIGLVAEDSG